MGVLAAKDTAVDVAVVYAGSGDEVTEVVAVGKPLTLKAGIYYFSISDNPYIQDRWCSFDCSHNRLFVPDNKGCYS